MGLVALGCVKMCIHYVTNHYGALFLLRIFNRCPFTTPRIKIGLLRRLHVIWLSFHPKIDFTQNPRRDTHIPPDLLAYSIKQCTCIWLSSLKLSWNSQGIRSWQMWSAQRYKIWQTVEGENLPHWHSIVGSGASVCLRSLGLTLSHGAVSSL